jgi:hypothetical protein
VSRPRDGAVLQIACLFGIIAGVRVTTMLVVQVGNNMVRAEMRAVFIRLSLLRSG